MELKKLEVPTSSITEVKRSPMDVFEQARQAKTGVYVFNREKVAGVMLTQIQYETLLQEIDDLRTQLTDNIQIKMHDDEVAPGLEELYQNMKKTLVTASSIAAKFIDERMVSFGFITRKTGFGGVVDMINEMKQSGKITYQLRQKIEGKNIVAEIIGELDDRSNLFDHIIINKIYLKEL